ncbi:histidine kinase [Actinoplanes sp. NPDC026670]|uniref:sensor histidine kinase n=1 Tax=Actinoplanes sp. NPDC026670 TaxID=3154700 RepID=UPI0033CE8F18
MSAFERPAWRNRAVPVVLVVAAVLIMAMCTVGAEGPAARVIPVLICGGAAAATAWAVRRWRADRAEYERRLTEWAATEAVLAERLHLARDLHDLVSHGLGLITVRVAATRYEPEPAQMRAALDDIEAASRETTAELRRMLTVLRDPGSPGPRAPLEGLEALPEIVRAARTAGLRVELTTGELGEVSPGVQVAVCRTVREGLANTARHAGPADVAVRVRRDGPHLVVSVSDSGPGVGWRATPGAGHGLAGLRERVTSLAGTLTTEHVDGGFHLVARIPDEPPP